MSTVNGTPGTTLTPTATTQSSGAFGSAGTATGAQIDPLLDKNAFLKLMMTQLKDQDPLNPQDPSQYLGQLAQMTTVEQETNIAESAAQTAAAQSDNTAIALLGHTVSYVDAQGNTQTGSVQKVDFASGTPSLTINGVSGISPAAVSEVS
jgi:flagellar basal-body rod modification protein FlgD